jgi:ATP-binding cassette subfamily B protein
MNIESKKPEDKSFSAASLVEMFRNMWAVSKMVWKESKKLVVLMTFVTIALTMLSFMRSGANGLLVNELARATRAGAFTERLVLAIAFLIAAYALPSIVSSLRRYWDKSMHMVMSESFELMILRKRSELDLARCEEPAFQDLNNRANERGIFSFTVLMEGQYDMLSTIAGIVIASVILLSVNKGLWFMIVLGEIPSLIVQLRYSHNVWDIYDTQSTTKRKFFHLRNKFQDGSTLSELQLFQNTRHFLSRIEGMLRSFSAEHAVNDRKRFYADVIAGSVSTLAISLAIMMIIVNVVYGTMQIGTWLFIAGTMFSFQSSFSGFFNSVARLYEFSLFATDMRKVLATGPVIKRPQNGIKVCRGKIPEVELRNMTFAYPGKEEPILKDISLTIRPGEILAIVGENGAGKTTLSKLLCRNYDPTKGGILIDGVDLRTIDLESWYAELAVLGQTYSNYWLQADEAIALGRTDETMKRDRVINAARFSEADKFIEKFNDGYSQQLGKEFGGVEVSKGQSQRLALARAVGYRDARFIILDEPTAATDAKAEAAIFERFYALRGKVSAILISHNYANVMKADRICVIDNGSIAELGSHAELMELDGIYAKLFRLQAERFQK